MRLAPEQRHAILQEMGIQTYVPRVSLPGAKASPEPRLYRSIPANLSPMGLQAPIETAEKRSAPVVAAVPAAASQPAETAPVQLPPQDTQAVHFAFAYVPVNEQLAVICELPWARSAILSPSCSQLLADMLKAIGTPFEAERLSPMVFSWPLADAGEMPQDAQTARDMLEGFLSRRLKLRAVPHLLVLAEQSAEFLFPAGGPLPASGLQAHPRLAAQVLVTHSLHAMESVRDLKRSAWQALQPLRRALADSPVRHQRPQV